MDSKAGNSTQQYKTGAIGLNSYSCHVVGIYWVSTTWQTLSWTLGVKWWLRGALTHGAQGPVGEVGMHEEIAHCVESHYCDKWKGSENAQWKGSHSSLRVSSLGALTQWEGWRSFLGQRKIELRSEAEKSWPRFAGAPGRGYSDPPEEEKQTDEEGKV